MLTIWGRADSSNVQAVMWAVNELRLPHKRIDAGHRFGKTDSAEFLSMNPNGTVPVLIDGDGPGLWESGAILRYLANTYAGAPFWPTDHHARAHVDRWAEWSKINIGLGFMGPIFGPVWRTPHLRNEAALEAALSALTAKLRIADAQLEKTPYLAGNDLTLADIQFGHVLYRYFDIDIPRAHLPHIERYYQALMRREAYREHVMVSYKALRE